MNNSFTWYSTLIKPTWAPPSWIFSPVWTFLYILIAISFGYVFYKAFKKDIKYTIVLPFALNLLFNFAFSPIQFILKNNILAMIDILFVLATLIWAMIIIYRKYRWVTYILIPYLLWVIFATVLQITVTYLNL